MASSIQVKRGTTAKVAAYTPLVGELVLDTTTNKLYAGDGSTAGGIQVVASKKGATDGSSAASGEAGEYLTATSSSAVSMTTGTGVLVVSLALTAGDWDLDGVLNLTPSATVTNVWGAVGQTSGTIDSFPARYQSLVSFATNSQFPVPTIRLITSASTTVYLNVAAQFSSGTCTALGFIRARRVR